MRETVIRLEKATYSELFADTYVAVLEAQTGTGQDALAQLASHINTSDPSYHALPGFEGNTPVLRLALRDAVTPEAAEQKLGDLVSRLHKEGHITGSPPCAEYDTAHIPPDSLVGKIQDNAGKLAGMTWQISNAMLVYSTLNEGDYMQSFRQNKAAGNDCIPIPQITDKGQFAMAMGYAISNTVVMTLTGGKPRSAEQLTRDLDNYLHEHGLEPLTSDAKKGVLELAGKARDVVRRYPWESAAIMDTTGNMLNFAGKTHEYFTSGYERDVGIKALGALSAIGATAVQMFVPQENGDSLELGGLLKKLENNPVYNRVSSAVANFTPARKTGQLLSTMAEHMSPHRHQIISSMNGLNNLGLLVTAAEYDKGNGLQVNNTFQAGSALLTAGGYGLQALGKDVERLSPEQASFVCALYMNEKLQGKEGPALEAEAEKLSEAIGAWLKKTDGHHSWLERGTCRPTTPYMGITAGCP